MREQTIADGSPRQTLQDDRRCTAIPAIRRRLDDLEGKSQNDQDEITYLLELRDTTKGRLRNLTIQRAAFRG